MILELLLWKLWFGRLKMLQRKNTFQHFRGILRHTRTSNPRRLGVSFFQPHKLDTMLVLDLLNSRGSHFSRILRHGFSRLREMGNTRQLDEIRESEQLREIEHN